MIFQRNEDTLNESMKKVFRHLTIIDFLIKTP